MFIPASHLRKKLQLGFGDWLKRLSGKLFTTKLRGKLLIGMWTAFSALPVNSDLFSLVIVVFAAIKHNEHCDMDFISMQILSSITEALSDVKHFT